MSRQAPWEPSWLRERLNRWRERDARAKDGALALALTVLAFVPTLSDIGAQIGDLPERPANTLGLALTLAMALPLAVRRRWPAACLAVVAGAFAAHQALGFATTFASVGLYLALFSAGAHQVRFRRALAVAAGTGYAVLAFVLDRLGSPTGVPEHLAFSLTLAAVWLAGDAAPEPPQRGDGRRPAGSRNTPTALTPLPRWGISTAGSSPAGHRGPPRRRLPSVHPRGSPPAVITTPSSRCSAAGPASPSQMSAGTSRAPCPGKESEAGLRAWEETAHAMTP
ncbi:hypothetical protein [Streptomyces sp. NPDC059176]|uniref:DUF7134 domain-containing protein n=1 Tax=Streptomyces sp. NPDC059176 TaxID=3346758 RepID=UPI0036BC0175